MLLVSSAVGYSFVPHGNVPVGCSFSSGQMTYVRMIMIEAGTVAGDGFVAALSYPGLETCADTVPTKKFLSNDGWHITAHEAAFIAARLRRAVELNVIAELLVFLDDRPDAVEVRDCVEEFAAFNERAAEQGGYYVR